jgi:hypothetical protein
MFNLLQWDILDLELSLVSSVNCLIFIRVLGIQIKIEVFVKNIYLL